MDIFTDIQKSVIPVGGGGSEVNDVSFVYCHTLKF